MLLFKNVDIKDLDSILKNGVLSASKSNNHNWDADKRADNSEEVVYLFKPTTAKNSYTQYGLALLEIEVDENDVKVNKLTECDHNDYVEYVAKEIRPAQIKTIFVPEIAVHSNNYEVSDFVKNQITLVAIEGTVRHSVVENEWINTYKSVVENIDEVSESQLIEWFKNTLVNSDSFNFFRGVTDNRPVDFDIERYAI